jgi:phosphatidylserine/phosphatidylglycerophosphate/cardiolipin synthase-like enzyme
VALQRIQKIQNTEVRIYDIHKLTGGIIHAKYFVVDGQELFIGSQNFDWRALDQIHETGARIKDAALSKQLQSIFEIDWQICATGQAPTPPQPTTGHPNDEIELVASPPQFNPEGTRGSIDALLELMNGAKKRLQIQVMDYSAGKNKNWPKLDDAMRAAAARGVQVQFLLSNWAMVDPGMSQLKDLTTVKNIEVRFTNIPQYSGGCIPYARLVHSKFMVVDDDKLWVSTSNWSEGYFDATRDVDLVIRRADLNLEGQAIFSKLWDSPYTVTMTAQGTYSKPDVTCGQPGG